MNNLEYHYVTVIAASIDRVWEGLTLPEFTEQYWHSTRARSDWKKGSKVEFLLPDGRIGSAGEILEVDAPRRLSYTWQFPQNPETRDEAPSRVTFELESIATGTILTVTHDRFPEGSKMHGMVSQGWPLVLGGLKTLLETGKAVDFSSHTP